VEVLGSSWSGGLSAMIEEACSCCLLSIGIWVLLSLKNTKESKEEVCRLQGCFQFDC
jgi:hypothetical protein